MSFCKEGLRSPLTTLPSEALQTEALKLFKVSLGAARPVSALPRPCLLLVARACRRHPLPNRSPAVSLWPPSSPDQKLRLVKGAEER